MRRRGDRKRFFDIEPWPASHPLRTLGTRYWQSRISATYRGRHDKTVLRGYRLEYREVLEQTNKREVVKQGDGTWVQNEALMLALGLAKNGKPKIEGAGAGPSFLEAFSSEEVLREIRRAENRTAYCGGQLHRGPTRTRAAANWG